MPRTNKIYIFVPFAEKEEAKALGAKWDNEAKQFYYTNNLDSAKFNKWATKRNKSINNDEAIGQFIKALKDSEFIIDSELIADGKLHRCKVMGDKGADKSGAYILHLDGYPAGYIENFKLGIKENWKYKLDLAPSTINKAQLESIKRQNDLKVLQRQQEQENLQEQTAFKLKNEYDNASLLNNSHTYLKAKGLESINDIAIKIDRFGNLLIPLSDINGKMWSVQRIMPNGSKLFGVIRTQQEKDNNIEYSAKKKGCFYTNQSLDSQDEFYIAEGFATAKSIEILIKKPVIAALDAGNLLSVCDELVAKYPHKPITICADNDIKAEMSGRGNVGLNAAMKCKEKYPQISIVKPLSDDINISDFNDLVKIKGLISARANINAQIFTNKESSKQEKRGIYNVTFNDKKATPIVLDMDFIENAILEKVAMYVKGYHNEDRNKGLGAEHIKLHLEDGADGEITISELVNLGNSLRRYSKTIGEPFIENQTSQIYEWENKDRVRFRAIIDKQRGGPQLPLSPSTFQIITFYSDRNLNEPMKFKNPKVEAYYQNKTIIKNIDTKNKGNGNER